MSNKSTLKPPVSYQGGKQRLSKEIIDIIFEDNFIDENTKFYDLCSGSGAISLELVNRGIPSNNITMVDAGVYGYFWQLLADGQFNYKDFEQEVNKIPINKDEVKQHMEQLITEPVQDIESMVYRFLLLQAGSFGGKQISVDNENQKWNPASFRNYWKPTPTSNRKSPVNPMQPMPDTILQRVKKLIDAELMFEVFVTDIYNILEDFTNYNSNTIIYIDPPYKNTSGYNNSFDWEDFLGELFNVTSSPVYVSECKKYSDDAILLNINNKKGGISGNKKRGKKEEWLNIFK